MVSLFLDLETIHHPLCHFGSSIALQRLPFVSLHPYGSELENQPASQFWCHLLPLPLKLLLSPSPSLPFLWAINGDNKSSPCKKAVQAWVCLLPPCTGWAVQAGRWDEGKACPIGFYRKLLFLCTLVVWLICSSSIFGNINPVHWDYECGDAWSSCLHMSYLLQKKNMLLLLLLLLILSSIISSLLLCLSLTSSQLHVAPYLLRLLRRPQLSFPAQHQESLWTNFRQRGQKAKKEGRGGREEIWKWAKLLQASPGAKPAAFRDQEGKNLVWWRGEGQKKLETGFPCGMLVLNNPPSPPPAR